MLTSRSKGRFALAHNYDSRHTVIVPQGVESGTCGMGQAQPHLTAYQIRIKLRLRTLIQRPRRPCLMGMTEQDPARGGSPGSGRAGGQETGHGTPFGEFLG